MTDLIQQTTSQLPYRMVPIIIAPADRSQHHQQIEQRFQQILASGFEQEVVKLRQRGDLQSDLPALRSVGYRQMWRYLAGEISRQQMEYQAICATRQLAKRQMTWLKRWRDHDWFDSNQLSVALQYIIRLVNN